MTTRREAIQIIVGAAAATQLSAWVKFADEEAKKAKEKDASELCLVNVSILFDEQKLTKVMPLFDFIDFKTNTYRSAKSLEEMKHLCFIEAFSVIDEINAARV